MKSANEWYEYHANIGKIFGVGAEVDDDDIREIQSDAMFEAARMMCPECAQDIPSIIKQGEVFHVIGPNLEKRCVAFPIVLFASHLHVCRSQE